MKYFWTMYIPSYPKTLLYMLQGSEYDVPRYLEWLHRTHDFRSVMKRRTLDYTAKIKLLTIIQVVVIISTMVFIGMLLFAGQYWPFLAVILLLIAPIALQYIIILPLWLGQVLIQKPQEKRIILTAHQTLSRHKGVKIAIAGSFGKTTAKEILLAVLGEEKKVAATPGNMNTPIGISRFIQKLEGNEDILIFELGEEKIGDVEELCNLVRPDIGIITGINEAHLSSFKTLKNTVDTIFELHDFLGEKSLYANSESELVQERLQDLKASSIIPFNKEGTGKWQISDAEVDFTGTTFSIRKDTSMLWMHTGLVGEYNLGILSAAIAIADSFGIASSHIVNGLKKLEPFEHRMQPRKIHGAWVIDDTYNGNRDGVKVGLKLLSQLPAARRIYVTPGLVEQGDKTSEIHIEIGYLIAEVADIVVLMQNSVTKYIVEGLKAADYTGKIQIVDEPLEFYTHLDQFVAAGDVVLMQNDWTDNYT